MSITELAAHLVGEPWCLTPAEIGRLTIGQVSSLYFAHRDSEGRLRIRDPHAPKPQTPKAAFVWKWMRWGLSRERALEKWTEEQAKAKGKKRSKRRGK